MYDPKVTDKTKVGGGGAAGNVLYDYTAVPRYGGTYTIPPVSFCYFDTEAKAYRTLRTDSLHLQVQKGANHASHSTASQKELVVLNNDIRHIKTEQQNSTLPQNAFFGTYRYWATYAALTLLFGVLAWILRRQIKTNTNGERQRGRKAGKEAQKRLHAAKGLMQKEDVDAFYEELMRALWGFVADKLNLPVSQLGKDNVSQSLALRGVEASEAEQFLRVLADCEFARFAPGNSTSQMNKLYSEATTVINQLNTKL